MPSSDPSQMTSARQRRPIVTPFDSTSTAADVIAGRDLHGLRAVVTGGASGIGLETGRALAEAGAEVTLAVRNLDAGRRAAAEIGGRVFAAALDLADLNSVAAFVSGWSGPLHLLINNAGVMRLPELQRTPSGVELQFATNHLGHFVLALGLRAALQTGAAERGEARIVAVSSRANLDAPVTFDDVSYQRRPYDPAEAYGQSKTANVLFAVEATRRWQQDGIVANAVNPGGVATNLQRHMPAEFHRTMAADPTGRTPQQGAATTLVAAIAPELAHAGGRYLENGQEAPTIPDDADEHHAGVRAWALDPDLALRLWQLSGELVDSSGTR